MTKKLQNMCNICAHKTAKGMRVHAHTSEPEPFCVRKQRTLFNIEVRVCRTFNHIEPTLEEPELIELDNL